MLRWKSASIVSLALLAALAAPPARASDHDDGETDLKSRSLNLTDLYVFREGDQSGVEADNANLIFVMNTNPRSLARQQYYFSAQARYEFHVTRRATRDDPVTGMEDVLLRLEFGAPDASGRQPVTLTAVRDGQTLTLTRTAGGMPIQTTLLGDAAPIENELNVGGDSLTLFAGLREDPFFFDVEAFFRVRAGALGLGPAVGFRPPAEAIDFAKGYNVNAIVLRIPIAFLAGDSGAQVFDVWETISIPDLVTAP
ncbi:DUF4331 domain-containing protein [Deltaproteobacteria bacterium PRO3]|nr:DUF4331 domain-containing protein [Deltaproteobacteria bacterium PRO3]